MSSVASEGSHIAPSDDSTLVIANSWTFLSTFGFQPLWHKTFSEIVFSPPLFQYHHHHFLLPRSLHLFPWPGQRLVWEPGSVFTLEREEEAELPQLRRRGVLRPFPWSSRSSRRSLGLLSLGFNLTALCRLVLNGRSHQTPFRKVCHNVVFHVY